MILTSPQPRRCVWVYIVFLIRYNTCKIRYFIVEYVFYQSLVASSYALPGCKISWKIPQDRRHFPLGVRGGPIVVAVKGQISIFNKQIRLRIKKEGERYRGVPEGNFTALLTLEILRKYFTRFGLSFAHRSRPREGFSSLVKITRCP